MHALVNQVVGYCLATAQEKYGISIHTFCVMSNHWHLVFTDVYGNFPDFLRDVHANIAKCVNASLAREGQGWEARPPHVMQLAQERDFYHWGSYVIANPVSAGLVEVPEEWPGMIATRFEQTWTVERPTVYFDESSNWPAEATLKLSPPVSLTAATVEQIQAMLDGAVEERVLAKREQMGKRMASPVLASG